MLRSGRDGARVVIAKYAGLRNRKVPHASGRSRFSRFRRSASRSEMSLSTYAKLDKAQNATSATAARTASCGPKSDG